MRTALLAALIALAAVACSSDDTTAAPPSSATSTGTTAVATSTAKLGAFTDDEKAYLRVIDMAHVPYVDPVDIVAVGHGACQVLSTGADRPALIAKLARDSGGVFNGQEAATIVGAAQGALCPR